MGSSPPIERDAERHDAGVASEVVRLAAGWVDAGLVVLLKGLALGARAGATPFAHHAQVAAFAAVVARVPLLLLQGGTRGLRRIGEKRKGQEG